MKEEVEKNKNVRYFIDTDCHDQLFNYKSKKYNNHKISDYIHEYNGNYERVTNKYIGFTISKKS
jgi:hypothetical protein